MTREKEPEIERLLRWRKEGKIKDFSIQIQSDPEWVDPVTGSRVHPVTCITIEKNNGNVVQISIGKSSDKK
jgi:hypothetical protein